MRLELAILLLIGMPSVASAQNALLPTGRKPVVLQSGTRNPFGQVVTAQEPVATEAAESEEMRLRRIIALIKVGGMSGPHEKLRVLLGSLLLKSGDTLPPLIPDQREALQVTSINKDAITLTFVDKDTTVEPRLVRIPIKIAASVSKMFYGEAVESLEGVHFKAANTATAAHTATEPLQLKGVQDFIDGSKAADLRNVKERKVELMGVVRDAEESK